MKLISNRVMGPALILSAGLAFAMSSAGARSVPDLVTAPLSPGDTLITIRTHDANRVRLPLTGSGGLADPERSQPLLWNGDAFLYSGSLWIGARILNEEGTEEKVLVSTTALPAEFRPSSGPAGQFRETREGDAGGGRADISIAGDDDRDGVADEDPLNGLDDDQDGRIDEDFAAAGAQMLTVEYRDDQTPVQYHEPLGLRVRQRSMAWNGAKTLDFIGLEYEITNVGDRRLTDVYAGFDLDCDVGPPSNVIYWTDDLAGFTTVDVPAFNVDPGCPVNGSTIDILYAWDARDNGTTIAGGDTPGYIGAVFLGYEADELASGFYGGKDVPEPGRLTTVRWVDKGSQFPEGRPYSDGGRYSYMSAGRVPSRNANKPADYTSYAFTGPFARLDPGDHITLAFALVLGNGYDDMVANAVAAKRVYDGFMFDGDQDPKTGVGGRETCLPALDPPDEAYWDDPCDATVNYIQPAVDPCTRIDADCDPCTGVDGRESRLHWVGAATPLPPESNVDADLVLPAPGVELYAVPAAGDARVTLQWDNASELQPDPVTHVNLFEGYRVWRADAYAGPGDQTPPEAEWRIVAEWRRNPVRRDSLICDHCRRWPIERIERNAVRRMTPYGPLYHIGRYQWTDSLGVINGKAIFYAVTAFGTTTRVYPDHTREVEIATSPALAAHRVIVPQWAAGSGCASVKIVPNPYHGDAEWDLTPSDCDPSGRKIAFRSLPEGWTSLHIYTLAGDLVLSAGPEDSRVVGGCETSGTRNPGGTFFWDLIGDGGRQVTSGVFLYTLESPEERCKGRFVIIR